MHYLLCIFIHFIKVKIIYILNIKTMAKKRLFFEILDPKGSNYSTKLKFYNSLKNESVDDIEIWISTHLRMTQILHLLAQYIKQEVDIDETSTNRIRVTQQQFDNFFSIIKTREKEG